MADQQQLLGAMAGDALRKGANYHCCSQKENWDLVLSCSVSILRQEHDVVGQSTQEQFVTSANGGSGTHG
jgi:hypothetical protein